MRSRLVALYRGITRRRLVSGAAVTLAGVTVLLNLYVYFWVVRYTFAVYALRHGVGDTVFCDARGQPWFRLDEQRRDVHLDQISPHLRRAVIAVEDHRFYRHPGIDPLGIARAAFRNARAGRSTEGGSTITQQLARTLFLSNERTWARKSKEALAALILEQQLTKDQILELYLNRIYLSGGVYGVENISRRLLGKPARDVTLPEAALIAGLIRAPSALSPWSNPEGALSRMRVVLARMREEGFITPDQERSATAARPRILSWAEATSRHGYAKDYLRRTFREQHGEDNPANWKVYTTFLPELQEAAERAIERGLARAGRPGLQAALVALRTDSGDIVALAGGRDYSASQFNRAVRSRRQPGSAFKPFVFAAALERGYSPASVLSGLKNIAGQGPEEWIPRNAEGDVPDALTLREALLESNNRAAVVLQEKIGSGPVLRVAWDLGMRSQPDVPSLALGSGVVTPLELTAAYAVFPNGGWVVRPRCIIRAVDSDGGTAYRNEVQRRQVLSSGSAWQMVSMLSDVVERGTGASLRQMGIRFAVAGKTGTTNEFKDAWFAGFTPELAVGVWVGFDQPQTIAHNAYGARTALPIWADFIRSAARVIPPGHFRMPEGIREEQLCRVSYLRPMDDCPLYTEYFKPGDSIPSELCPVHSGNIRQLTRRAVEGIVTGLGRRLRSLFE